MLICGIKNVRPMVTTEVLIYQSNANFDVKILFGKIALYLDPELRKTLVRGLYGDENFMFYSAS